MGGKSTTDYDRERGEEVGGDGCGCGGKVSGLVIAASAFCLCCDDDDNNSTAINALDQKKRHSNFL